MSVNNRFDLCLPDPNTYTIVINEYMRALIQKGLEALLREQGPADTDEREMTATLRELIDPNGSTGPLAHSPAVNGLVL